MNKYSIQNECLEMIEAFSDEQMTSEMSVIESVLDIFEKTVLMMELSNSDVDIPDCSMFMESTFFQELDPPATESNPAPSQGEPTTEESNSAPATNQPSDTNASSNSNTQNNTMSEADRKNYNKEHWVRMKNKKGNIENIFISIIAFIPRLLGFILQSIVRFFKKLFNKDTDKKAEAVANATDEQKAKVAEQVGETVDSSTTENDNSGTEGQGQPAGDQQNNAGNGNNHGDTEKSNTTGPSGAVNVKNSTTKYFDADAVVAAISDIIACIDKLTPGYNEDVNNTSELIKAIAEIGNHSGAFASVWPQAKSKFDAAIVKEVEIDIKAVPGVKTKIGNAFNELQRHTKTCWNVYNNMTNSAAAFIRNTNKDENGNANAAKNETDISQFRDGVMPAKKMCEQLKALAQDVAKNGLGAMAKVNANYTKNIDILYNAIANVSHGNINNPDANDVKNIDNMK